MRILRQGRIVGLDARRRQQLRQDGLVLVRALAQIGGGEMEAEHLHGPDQRRQTAADHGAAVIGLQRLADGHEVGEEVGGLAVGLAGYDRVAQRLGVGEGPQRAGEPAVDAGERAAVGLVRPMRAVVAGSLGQRLQGRRARRQGQRYRQLGAELDAPRSGSGAARSRRGVVTAMSRVVGIDVGVAVAVAADPVAHAEEAAPRAARGAASRSA